MARSAIVNVRCVAFHEQPHYDEILGYWIIRTLGEPHFPGIEDAEVIFWPNNGSTPDGRPTEAWEEEGCLQIGVGGGRFDEHPSQGKGRKEKECAATLIAKHVGISEDQDPALWAVLSYALNEDLNAGTGPWSLPSVVKVMNVYYRHNPNKVFEWVMDALDAIYAFQKEFAEAVAEFRAKAECETFQLKSGQLAHMTIIPSANEAMVKAAMHMGANVVVIVKPNGNVQILTKKNVRFSLALVAAQIRLAERRIKGIADCVAPEILQGEEAVLGAEEWYYNPRGQFLLNGSRTAQDAPPTRIPITEIKAIIRSQLYT